jgi:hypothetical protein
MIKVTIELWPHGDETRKRLIASMDIWNTGSGTPLLGAYGFRRLSASGVPLRHGVVGEFKRTQHNVWQLLQGVLGVLYSDQSEAWRDGKPTGRLLGTEERKLASDVHRD